MTVGTAKYPRRRPFFANRFCRLMTKVCLANQVGPESCFLLMTIAMTEDAKSYRGPVTFWNEQLVPLLGLNNVKALARIRDRAVESGWLHYEPGGKGRPGVYWVDVPESFRGMDDAPVDENVAEYSPALLDKIDPQSGREVGKKAGEKRERSGQHSSLTPDLEESPTVSGATPAPAEVKQPRKEPTGPHADCRRAFCERWKAKYGEDYAFDFAKHGKLLAQMLKFVKDDVAKMIGIIERFLADDDPFYAADSRHDFARLRQHFNRWLVSAPPPTPTGPPRPAGGFKTKAEKDRDILAQQMIDSGAFNTTTPYGELT